MTWERLGDVAVVALIVLFAWLGVQVHNSIAGLADMARGIQATGTSIQRAGVNAGGEIRRSVSGAADAAEAVPFVGGRVGSALRDTASSTSASIEREARTTGAQLRASGREGERQALATARLVGWLSFLIPTVALLAVAVPWWTRRWRAHAGGPMGVAGRAGPGANWAGGNAGGVNVGVGVGGASGRGEHVPAATDELPAGASASAPDGDTENVTARMPGLSGRGAPAEVPGAMERPAD